VSKLEDLQPDATVRGILPDALVTVVSIAWHGSDALTLVYRAPNGRVADEILYRHDEPRLEVDAEIPSGAPDHVVRTVTENSRTLRFSTQGFEKE
jgi:hypothetical protein